VTAGRRGRIAALAALLVVVAAVGPALAQRHPFAVGGAEAACAADGFGALILAWQSKFHAELQASARALKTDPSAFFLLAAASFAYGAFHAAGPGHGKAVLAAYMVANDVQLRRGLLLAALAALLQGLVAIALVLVAALVFGATASRMTDAAHVIEVSSYAAIALLGARLVYVKGRGLLGALRQPPAGTVASRFVCEAIDDPAHVHGPGCGHAHAPDPATLSGPGFRWRDALGAVVAAGLRPCSGAILLLVFALSQGTLLAGAGAVLAMSAGTALTTGAIAGVAVHARGLAIRLGGGNSGRRAETLLRAAECLAALLVLGFGLALLAGLGATCRAA
jgi:ABC-type nickel/cobalt efflux system permease component RcnA